MADSILRLRVDSSEHDNKLKKASESLQRYADGCRKAGGTLEYVDEGVADFVRSLGKMETSSNSLRGKIGELTKSFTDLSHQYNQMTEAEKSSDYGKALKASLDDIKVRIKDSKQELDSINSSINGGGGLTGALDSLAGKFGLNIGELTKFGSVAGVATTALKVAKDAFFQSEQNIDEFGRTLKGAESAYDVFLQTLNNGNWSQFFSNLETAIRGGRDLYDLFDRLGSVKANNSVAIAMTQAEIQQLRLLKQAGQDVDDKIKAATQRLAQLQGQSTQAGIAAGKGQVVNTLRNGVNSIEGARINDATLNRVADNISKQGQAYFDFMKRRAAALEQKGMVTRTQTINDSQGGTYERQYRVFDINQLSKEQQKQYAIAKTVTERETEIQKGLSVWSQSVREQASNSREIFRDNRYSLQGSGSGKGGSGSSTDPAEQAAKKVADAEFARAQAVEMATMEVKNGTATEAQAKQKEYSAMESLWKAYGDAYNTTKDPKYKEAQDKLAAELQAMGVQVTLSKEAQKQMEEAYRQVAAQTQKLASAQEEANKAISSGDLKSFYAADKKIVAAGGQSATTGADLSQSFGATTANIDAFIANLKEKISQSEVGTDLYNSLTAQLADASMLSNMIQLAMKNGVDMAQFNPQDLWTRIFGNAEDIDTTQWEEIRAKLEEIIGKPITIDVNTGALTVANKAAKDSQKEFQAAASAIQQAGSAMQSIEDPSAKVMGIVAQAIGSIALGFAQASAQEGKGGIWYWIAATAAGLATMVSTISAIHSATGYAQGGIVKGNSYSGDNIGALVDGSQFVGLNAGEVVLNAAQQQNLASNLQGEGGGGMRIVGVLKGHDMALMLDRWGMTTGRGELLFAKNL